MLAAPSAWDDPAINARIRGAVITANTHGSTSGVQPAAITHSLTVKNGLTQTS